MSYTAHTETRELNSPPHQDQRTGAAVLLTSGVTDDPAVDGDGPAACHGGFQGPFAYLTLVTQL